MGWKAKNFQQLPVLWAEMTYRIESSRENSLDWIALTRRLQIIALCNQGEQKKHIGITQILWMAVQCVPIHTLWPTHSEPIACKPQHFHAARIGGFEILFQMFTRLNFKGLNKSADFFFFSSACVRYFGKTCKLKTEPV